MSPPNTSSPAACEDVVAEQAMRWIAWLASGDITDAGMCEFEEWLAQPGHRHAFEQQRTLWRSLGPRPAVASAVRRRRQRLR